MSNVNRNIETVRKLYEAFGRGDIPAALELLADQVVWEMESVDHGVPWLVPGRGRAHAAKFFDTLRGMQIDKFEVLSVMGDADWVVGLITIEFTWLATGKRVREGCEPHVWKFDSSGRIVAFRHAPDTHQHWLAAKD